MKKKAIQPWLTRFHPSSFILHPLTSSFILHPSSFMMSSHVEKVSGGIVAQSAEECAPVEHAAH
jgi:hypothetical protein